MLRLELSEIIINMDYDDQFAEVFLTLDEGKL